MKKVRVLLVEDDLFLRDIFVETLKEVTEYDVEAAEDGQVAYEKLKKGGWDMVLLDVNLPKHSGVEVMLMLEKEGITHPSKHIILMTNSDDPSEFDPAMHLVDGYWLKTSFTPDELLEKIALELKK